MNRSKSLAAGLNLAAGVWTIVVTLGVPFGGEAVVIPLQEEVFLLLGILLIVDSLVCFAGFRVAFPLGATLSVLVAALLAIIWARLAAPAHASMFVVAIVTMVGDIIAARSRERISEQGNPLNLPVFG